MFVFCNRNFKNEIFKIAHTLRIKDTRILIIWRTKEMSLFIITILREQKSCAVRVFGNFSFSNKSQVK